MGKESKELKDSDQGFDENEYIEEEYFDGLEREDRDEEEDESDDSDEPWEEDGEDGTIDNGEESDGLYEEEIGEILGVVDRDGNFL